MKQDFKFKEGFIKPPVSITITRIDHNKSFKPDKLIPIENDAYFYYGMRLMNKPLLFPQLYAAFSYVTGASDDWYDDYKGSFSFTFELNVKKGDNMSNYVYHIYHFRSYINFSTYQIVPQDDERNACYVYPSNEELFSEKDICNFSFTICNFVLQELERLNTPIEPFVKCADSNSFLFGYLDHEYFLKGIDTIKQERNIQNESDDDESIYTQEKLRMLQKLADCHIPYIPNRIQVAGLPI